MAPAGETRPAAVSVQARAWRVDKGRLIMIPGAAVLLAADAAAMARGSADPARVAGTALVCVFYALVIWCYLRRGAARATSGALAAHVAAIAATLAPFAIPLLAGPAPTALAQTASDALLLAGTGWSLWSLASLGRNISVLAQARGLADRGPYRWVRHPLYLGEVVSALGLAVGAGTATALGAVVLIAGLQACRARREEAVLLRALPEYRAYRRRTATLVPGVF